MDRKHSGGKRENAGYQHFLFSPTMFSKRYISNGSLKPGTMWLKDKLYHEAMRDQAGKVVH